MTRDGRQRLSDRMLAAARGTAVTATEPDAAMLTELRKHLPADVARVQGAFAQLWLTLDDDLVFAALLFWTEPAKRGSRVPALLTLYG
jgi:hypothetical protein